MHCSASGENASSFNNCSGAFCCCFGLTFAKGFFDSSCVSTLYFALSSSNIPFGKQADNNSGEIKLHKSPSAFECSHFVLVFLTFLFLFSFIRLSLESILCIKELLHI